MLWQQETLGNFLRTPAEGGGGGGTHSQLGPSSGYSDKKGSNSHSQFGRSSELLTTEIQAVSFDSMLI